MQERISTKQAMENLPTKERVRKGNVIQNEHSTRAQVKYFTPFPILEEMGVLDAEMERYHNEYMKARRAALHDLDTQTAQFLFSGDRATVPLPTTEATWTPSDLFNYITRHLKPLATEYVEYVCTPLKPGADIMAIRSMLWPLHGQIQYAFAELKKTIDDAYKIAIIEFE